MIRIVSKWNRLMSSWSRHIVTAGLAAGMVTMALPETSYAQEASQMAERTDWLDIELGKSIVLGLPEVPIGIAITDPDVADAVKLGGPMRWQVQGRSLGSTDLVVQFRGETKPMIYKVTVHRDISEFVRRVDSIVDGTPPKIYPLEERLVIEGVVPDLDTMERIAQMAEVYDPNFVNLMTVAGDHQVQLEVVLAEVSRTGLRSIGVNIMRHQPQLSLGLVDGSFDVNPGGFDIQTTPLINGMFNLYGLIRQPVDILAQIQILDDHKLGKILAQQSLVSLSGQQAEFLAGGEFPIPTPNAQGNINIKFREFGTRMLFIPTVLANNVIDVQVEVELSEIDASVSVRLAGIEVPGFISRKAKSHVRLRSGMTFAMAGLLAERTSQSRAEVPGLGRIPVLGAFFRSTTHTREETELVIYVTPKLVRPLTAEEVPPLPGTTENNNPSDLALFLLGATKRAGSQTAQPTGEVGLLR